MCENITKEEIKDYLKENLMKVLECASAKRKNRVWIYRNSNTNKLSYTINEKLIGNDYCGGEIIEQCYKSVGEDSILPEEEDKIKNVIKTFGLNDNDAAEIIYNFKKGIKNEN